MILRLLLKIKSYVHSPHSLLHNGLPCVQSLPPCLRPNKPSIYLCHVLFALWQWTIHRVKGTRKGWGRGPDTSSVLQPLCQERPKQEMEQRKFTQGRGERTEKRRTQRKWPSSGPLLWELILRIFSCGGVGRPPLGTWLKGTSREGTGRWDRTPGLATRTMWSYLICLVFQPDFVEL